MKSHTRINFTHNISLFWKAYDQYPHTIPLVKDVQEFLFHWVDNEVPPHNLSPKVLTIISLLMENQYENTKSIQNILGQTQLK